jgi:hypothetical protein
MPRSFSRYRDLKARKIVENRTQLKHLIEKYGFPRGVMLTPGARAWLDDEVELWLSSRPVAGGGDVAQPLRGRAKTQRERARAKAEEASATS